MKMSQKIMGCSVSCLAVWFMALTARGDSFSWINSSGGYWTNAINWQGGVVPTINDAASINVDGTYNVTARGTNTAQNITVGTSTSSGMQTLVIDAAYKGWLVFSNMTVGNRGVLFYGDNSFFPGTGTVTVLDGGKLRRGTGGSNGSFADHDLWIQPGASWSITNGATHTLVSNAKTVVYTIDGTLDGAGTLGFNNNLSRTWLTGTGLVSVAKFDLNNYNGNLFLGGSLTINSTVIQSNAISSCTVLTNEASITFNGPYLMERGGNLFQLFTNATTATVLGTNVISIVNNNAGNNAQLGGFKTTGTAGSLTIGGSGLLDVCQASPGGKTINFGAGLSPLNLQRNARFWATTNPAASFQPLGNLTLNLSGNTLTIDTNFVLRLHRGANSVMNVTNNATLVMRQGIFEGNGTPKNYNLTIGSESKGTLMFSGAGTNLFRRSADNTVTNYALTVSLGTNAVVNPELGSILSLQDCQLAIGITNSASWGWKSQGMIEVNSNAVVEALSTDRGRSVDFFSVGLGVSELSLSAPASSTKMSISLWNAGAPDNDGDSVTDAALYVKTLNLSGLPAGASVTLTNGTGVASGTARVYYSRLIGGSASQLDAATFKLLSPTVTIVVVR